MLLAAIVCPSVGRHIRVNPRTKVARWWIDAVDPRLKRNHLKGQCLVWHTILFLYYGMSCCLCMAQPLPQLNMAQPYLKLYGVSLVFTTVAPAVSTTTVVYNYRGALAVKFCYRDRAIVSSVIYCYRTQPMSYVMYSTVPVLCYVSWYNDTAVNPTVMHCHREQ